MPRTRRTARREATTAAANPADIVQEQKTSIVETKQQTMSTKTTKKTTTTTKTRTKTSRVQSVASGMVSAFKSPRKVKPARRPAAPDQKNLPAFASPRKTATTAADPETPERRSSSSTTKFASPDQRSVRKSLTGTGTPLHASPITPGRKKNLTASLRKSAAKTLAPSSTRKAAAQLQTRRGEGLFPSPATSSKSPAPKTETASAGSRDDDYHELDRKIHLKMLYSLIRRKTGALGGGGAGGAIYGEVTQESFQRVVDVLVAKCGLDTESVFLDIGAGLGKPNFHVAITPGVKQSLGVELIGGRWWQSVYLLDQCLSERTLRPYARKVFFAHANVTDMKEFEPTTHVYSFNRGFPPEAMQAVARAFHASSTAEYFICFDKPKVLEGYGFRIELVDFVPTKMAGSGEQHRCYVYRRTDRSRTKPSQATSGSSSSKSSSLAAAITASAKKASRAIVAETATDAKASAAARPKPRGKAPRSPALFSLARTPIRTRAYSKLKKVPASSSSSSSSQSQNQDSERDPRVVALNFDEVDEDDLEKDEDDEEEEEAKEDKESGAEQKTRHQEATKAKEDDMFTLVAPPKEIDYAPHVPHSDSYMQGLDLMASSVMLYQSWVRDQIGLHRSDRASRSSSRRQIQR